MNNDLIKDFFKSLDFEHPVAPGNIWYVNNLHNEDDQDIVLDLTTQINFNESAQNYFFTGSRGSGKSTELLRLRKNLEEIGCIALYVDMSNYLNSTKPLEVSDFIISLMMALSDVIENNYQIDLKEKSYFERISNFLKKKVILDEITLSSEIKALKAQFKFSLKDDPDFKSKLQAGLRGHIATLVKEARDFVKDAISIIRSNEENKKVVLIVDSIERIRGVGAGREAQEVYESMENLFSGHADNLRFSPLHIVYTIPPYLQVQAPNFGNAIGSVVYHLPSIHVFKKYSRTFDENGLFKMRTIIQKRYSAWELYFSELQLNDLIINSGGDLRDFLRLVRLSLVSAAAKHINISIPNEIIEHAKNQVRNELLPIPDNDKERLKYVYNTYQAPLKDLDGLTQLSRYTEYKYILNYRNGDNWWGVHPLIWSVIGSL